MLGLAHIIPKSKIICSYEYHIWWFVMHDYITNTSSLKAHKYTFEIKIKQTNKPNKNRQLEGVDSKIPTNVESNFIPLLQMYQ